MANDMLFVSTQKPIGNDVRDLIEKLLEVQKLFDRIEGNFNHLAAAPDFTAVATATTLHNAAGAVADPDADGEILYNLVTGAKSEFLADTNLQQFIDRIYYHSG